MDFSKLHAIVQILVPQQDWECEDLDEAKTLNCIQMSHELTGNGVGINFTKYVS